MAQIMGTDVCLPVTGSTPQLRTGQGAWPDGDDCGSRGFWPSASWPAVLWWGLVGFAAVDVIYAVPSLTGAWWCAYLVLWITPWREVSKSKHNLVTWLHWLSVTLVFSWLIYRTLSALFEPVSGWALSTSIPRLNLLSFPAHTIFCSFITALLVAAPLRRLAGEHAVAIGLLASLPYAVLIGDSDLFSLTRWLDKTLSSYLLLFDCLFPVLVIAEGASLHQRFFDRNDRRSLRRKRGWFPSAALSGQINAPLALVLSIAALSVIIWGQVWLDSFDLTNPSPAMLVIYATVFPATALLFLFTAAVAWRSLSRARRLKGRAVRFLITVAKSFLALAIGSVLFLGVFEEAPISGALVSEAIELAVGPLWTVEPAGIPGELRVQGDFQRGMAAALASELEAAPEVVRIELDSPGGSVQAGYALASLIQERGLATIVRGECASACILAFAAGAERTLVPGAKLGFHSYKFGSWTGTHEPSIEYLEERGVDAEFIRRGFDVPFEDMWYPDLEELLAAGIVITVSPEVGQW